MRDIYATALYHHMTIDELSNLDLAYTPPLSTPWDHTQMAALAWVELPRFDGHLIMGRSGPEGSPCGEESSEVHARVQG